jgi:2-keto-3-deoxy-galactonokinase
MDTTRSMDPREHKKFDVAQMASKHEDVAAVAIVHAAVLVAGWAPHDKDEMLKWVEQIRNREDVVVDHRVFTIRHVSGCGSMYV